MEWVGLGGGEAGVGFFFIGGCGFFLRNRLTGGREMAVCALLCSGGPAQVWLSGPLKCRVCGGLFFVFFPGPGLLRGSWMMGWGG